MKSVTLATVFQKINDEVARVEKVLLESSKKKPSLTIHNKIVYYGSLFKGRANGVGRGVDIVNGNVYIGNWKFNKMDGIGMLTLNDTEKTTYIGEFVENCFKGYGKLSFENPKYDFKSYEGWFKNNQPGWLEDDKKTNFAKLTYTNNAVYSGQITNKMIRKGKGAIVWKNGDQYDGMWENDKRHGHGVEIEIDGSKYVGEWENDKRHGHGIQTNKDGTSYDGNWSNGLRFGFGFANLLNGGTYIGEWKDDEFEGKGCLKKPSGDYISGTWVKSELLPNCVFVFVNGDSFSGIVDKISSPNGIVKLCGTGKFKIKKHQCIITGTFFESVVVGKCQVEFSNGTLFTGIVKQINPFCGNGDLVYANGMKYFGSLQDGIFHGYGTLMNSDKSYCHCQWINGLKHGKVYSYNPLYEKATIAHWENGTLVSTDNVVEIGIRKSRKNQDDKVAPAYNFTYSGIIPGRCKINYDNGDKFVGIVDTMYPFNAFGKYHYSSGETYYGGFSNGQLHGYGLWINQDKSWCRCYWNNGKKHGAVFYYDSIYDYALISECENGVELNCDINIITLK